MPLYAPEQERYRALHTGRRQKLSGGLSRESWNEGEE